jgi:hypothetical protein
MMVRGMDSMSGVSKIRCFSKTGAFHLNNSGTDYTGNPFYWSELLSAIVTCGLSPLKLTIKMHNTRSANPRQA